MLPGIGGGVMVIEVEIARRARKMQPERVGTPGGAKLRALRQQTRRTQLWVEAEAELGSGYLQRLESGKVAQPERATLARILAALAARYSEQRDVLLLFGYSVATPPPDNDDIAWAGSVCRKGLDEVAFPAYVLDCTHRLIAWNRQFPYLLGVSAVDPRLLQLERRSLLAPWFDPVSPLAALVAEPDVFLPALIRALRYELQQFRTESWYTALLAQLIEELPQFRRYWLLVQREPASASAARALVPVKLVVPGAGMLRFRLASEPFVRDARFRAIYYFPADSVTMQQCAAWAAEGATI